MLRADWFAAANDEIHPRHYPAGTVLTGELLERATALGLIDVTTMADPAPPEEPQIDVTTMADGAPQQEGRKALDGAPENKAGRKK